MNNIVRVLTLVVGVFLAALAAHAETTSSVSAGGCMYEESVSDFSSVMPGADAKKFCALHPAVAAMKWLQILHQGTDKYEVAMKFLRHEVDRGALRLVDIGTSEQELQKLSQAGARKAAEVWYEHLLRHPDEYELALAHIREETMKGEFNPAVIGDPLKIRQLTSLGARIVADRCLDKMRESGNTDDNAARCVSRQARIAGYSLAELGTNEVEVRYRGAREPQHPVTLWGPRAIKDE